MGMLNDLGYGNMAMGSLSTIVIYSIAFLIFLIIMGVLFYFVYQWKVYRYKVRIFRRRENGKVKELNKKGGYINRSTGAPFFRIKLGPFKTIDLTETPKLRYMDQDDRVYYNQIDINTFVQVKRVFEGDLIKYKPVESDVKYGAILSVQRIRDVLRIEPTWKKIVPFAALIILAIVFITSYSMLMDKCS